MAPIPRVVLIAGPTASGKTTLALRAAEALGGEVVNADALQLYTDLNVLTARPSPEEERRAPHHLFGVADAADGWSVGRWLNAALEVLADIAARGRPAVVVGGTGLYFRALTRGLAEIPQVPAAIRTRVAELYDALGEAAFRARLRAVDAAAEARISPGDRQRLCRALEVQEASGRPLTSWQRQTVPPLDAGGFARVVLEPPRAELYRRCDRRLVSMLQQGALAETAALVARGLDPRLPAMKAVGVRELARHLAGEIGLDEALALAQRETRRYAKRQTTWFSNQTPDWPRISETSAEAQWRQFLALNPALTHL